MLCGPREPFDYAIYGIVFRTLGNWSLEHRTSGKVPRIEANCWVIATHHTIPAIRLELSRAALPPKADKRETSPNVRLVPLADICSAANVRQGLSHGQFRVLACRVPFLQIRRNQLPPQVGCETARPLLSSTAAGLPSGQVPDSSLLRRFAAF